DGQRPVATVPRQPVDLVGVVRLADGLTVAGVDAFAEPPRQQRAHLRCEHVELPAWVTGTEIDQRIAEAQPGGAAGHHCERPDRRAFEEMDPVVEIALLDGLHAAGRWAGTA